MGNIYLAGFMATGKSAIGKELAKQKKMLFVDLDELIELRSKQVIADIFAKKGEAYFRKIEKEALRDISKEKNCVVACGGGIVLDAENIKIMQETGEVFCLTASSDVILKRAAGYSHRPLLNVKDPKKQIEHLLKLRAPYYAKIKNKIDTSKLSIKQVVAKIIK